MRLGCCASIEKAEILKRAGFDFIECTVTSLIPNEEDHIFRESVLKPYLDSPIPVETFNIFIPGELSLVGDSIDWKSIHRYLDHAFERMKIVGGDTVVFGSGGARKIPNGFNRENAEDQLVEFLNVVADKAEATGITVVIEPLNQKECNVINSVEEGVTLAKRVNHSSIQVLADFYHMDEEKETLDHIVSSSQYLKHIHVADTGRMAPGTGSYPYEEFAAKVREANYKGRVSIECNWSDFDNEVEQARVFLDSVFNK